MSKPVIAYAFDLAYLPYAKVSTASVKRNAAGPLHIYWLMPKEDAYKVVAPDGVTLIPVAPFEPPTTWYITPSHYLRWRIFDTLQEDKVIYLDADTLVQGDIKEVWDHPLADTVVAGVKDPFCSSTANLRLKDWYLGTGVLLLDLKKLKEEQALEKLLALASNNYVWGEQCALNVYAEGRKSYLPGTWNAYSFGERSVAHSKLIHFAWKNKPLKVGDSNPDAALWWRHYRRLICSRN